MRNTHPVVMGNKNESDMSLVDFQIKILALVYENREDTFWDFKQEWHQNNAELLHDIICLANADHHGDRYLIFGITDPPECKIAGIQSDPNRKTQADLLDFLANAGFSGDLRPSVSIKSLVFPEGKVDVVIIKNINQKPFTLSKQFRDGRIYLHSGSVYTRVHDKNTAVDSTADLYFVERMWRERFGLDSRPVKKIQDYLLHRDDWIDNGENYHYFSTFPEFIIIIGGEEKMDYGQHWWHVWPINEPARYIKIHLKYHTTLLKSITTVHFDCENFEIPFPDIDYIPIIPQKQLAENTYCYYSFLETSINFSLLVYLFTYHFKNKNPIQEIKNKNVFHGTKPPLGYLPFPIFSCKEEKDSFLKHIIDILPDFLKLNSTYPCSDFGPEKRSEEKHFAYWAYDQFWKWKDK